MDAREKKLIIERGNVGKEGFRSMMGETGRMDETGDGRNKRPRVHDHSGDRNRNESKKGWLVRESRWEPIRNRKDGKNGENARSCKKRRREKWDTWEGRLKGRPQFGYEQASCGTEKVEDDIMIGQEKTGAVRKQESSCILYATMKRKRTVCLSWNPLKLNSNILVRDRTQCTHI